MSEPSNRHNFASIGGRIIGGLFVVAGVVAAIGVLALAVRFLIWSFTW